MTLTYGGAEVATMAGATVYDKEEDMVGGLWSRDDFGIDSSESR